MSGEPGENIVAAQAAPSKDWRVCRFSAQDPSPEGLMKNVVTVQGASSEDRRACRYDAQDIKACDARRRDCRCVKSSRRGLESLQIEVCGSKPRGPIEHITAVQAAPSKGWRACKSITQDPGPEGPKKDNCGCAGRSQRGLESSRSNARSGSKPSPEALMRMLLPRKELPRGLETCSGSEEKNMAALGTPRNSWKA